MADQRSRDELTVHVARILYEIAHTPWPGGQTQAVAKIQVTLNEMLDAEALQSTPVRPFIKVRQVLWDSSHGPVKPDRGQSY